VWTKYYRTDYYFLMKKYRVQKTKFGLRLSKAYKSSEANEVKLKNYIDERYFSTGNKKRT
jgi:hypothetical protein